MDDDEIQIVEDKVDEISALCKGMHIRSVMNICVTLLLDALDQVDSRDRKQAAEEICYIVSNKAKLRNESSNNMVH